MATSEGGYGGLIVILSIFLISTNGWPDWAVKGFYSNLYSVPFERVELSARPSDCDFLHTPIGSKGCSYKRNVAAATKTGNEVSKKLRWSHELNTNKDIASAG
jgi:hypothetical protein